MTINFKYGTKKNEQRKFLNMKAKDILISCLIGIAACALYDVSKTLIKKAMNKQEEATS